MSTLYISPKSWISVTLILHFVAINLGLFRLVHRYRTKQYYWDDLWAVFCLVFNVVIFAYMVSEFEVMERRMPQAGTTPYWILEIGVRSAGWCARISIAFSIIRIIALDVWRRRLMKVIITSFVLAWLGITLNQIVACDKSDLFIALPDRDCSSTSTQIILFCVHTIADGCLVFIPLHLLRNLRLPRASRFMVRVVFSVSGLSALAVLVHSVFMLYPDSHATTKWLTFMLMPPMSLIVCCLVVVIPPIYRFFKKEEVWIMSMSVNLDVSEARTVPDGPVIVSPLEPAVVKHNSMRSFQTLPVCVTRRSPSDGRWQLHTWPKSTCTNDSLSLLNV